MLATHPPAVQHEIDSLLINHLTTFFMQNMTSYTAIIAKYHALLERYARRFMLNKPMAYTVVKETLEKLYAQGRLIEGPQLRGSLKETMKECWEEIDASLARAEAALNKDRQHENQSTNSNCHE